MASLGLLAPHFLLPQVPLQSGRPIPGKCPATQVPGRPRFPHSAARALAMPLASPSPLKKQKATITPMSKSESEK